MSSLLSGSLSPTPAHPLASLFCVTLCHIATRSLRGEAVQTLSPPGMLGSVVWGLLGPPFSFSFFLLLFFSLDFADLQFSTDSRSNSVYTSTLKLKQRVRFCCEECLMNIWLNMNKKCVFDFICEVK